MRKKISRILSLVCVLFVSLFILSFNAFAEDENPETEPTEISYYLCLSTDNYQVRNTNKLTGIDEDEDGTIDYYEITNKTLSSNTEFYIISSEEVKYFASDGSNMKVDDADSFRYNIYFSPDFIYDKDRVANTDLYESNAHLTYEIYVPGAYNLIVNSTTTYSLKYNHYITTYDAYIYTELYLQANDVITVDDLNSEDTYTKTIETTGIYRIVFTPTVTRNSNEYRFNSEGAYGTGDEYTENLYLSDVEYYYIVFDETITANSVSTTLTIDDKDITGYRLIKDETAPTANVFKFESMFNTKKKTTYHYVIYHYSYIFNKYEIIDDDNDEDTDVSEKKLTDISWYNITFTYAEGSYTTAFVTKETDFGGYYLIGDFNHYGFSDNGEVELDEKYAMPLVAEDSEYYEEDYKQYLNSGFIITKDMLDEDEDDFEFYISNGKTKTAEIAIKTPGTYDILYSTETTYNNVNYKYLRTSLDEDTYTQYDINNTADFIKYMKEWNMDSESSKYVIYNINADLDFKDMTIPTVTVFNGTINGNGHVLKNISLTDENGLSEISVFKLVTKYAKIKNLEVDGLSITAKDSDYVALIAKNYGTLSGIIVNGSVTGRSYVGSIVGYNGNYQQDSDTTADSTVKYGYGVIENCVNKAVVNGKIIVGGLAGFNGGKIISSSNEGRVNNKYYSSSVTITNIGGLAGYSTGEIVDSYNKGIVGYKNIGSNIGGLVGQEVGEIYFSYNASDVHGKTYVGGIAGYYGNVEADSDSSSVSGIDIDGLDVSSLTGTADELAYTEETVISKSIITYSYSTGNVSATSYVGGLIGYSSSTGLKIANCFANGSIYANSGTYAAGLVAYLAGGSIKSCHFYGYVETNGSVNHYVGGIVAYLAGTVEGCYANATLNGNEYVGGIAGYVASTGYVLSCFTNVYMITKSTATCVGNIAGFVDGADTSSASFGDRVKYNYFVGGNLEDYSGINGANYGKASHYAAYRVTYEELKDTAMLDLISHKFGLIDEDDETYYFKKVESTPLPNLVNFASVDEIDDDDFDDDTNLYDSYTSYFEKYQATYAKYEEIVSTLNIRIIFKEWDSELSDNEPDNYVVTYIKIFKYDEDFAGVNPSFKYGKLENGVYYSDRDDALYIVRWNAVSSELSSKTIFANYEEIITSLYDSYTVLFVESEFNKDDTLQVVKDGTNYTITILNNGVEKTVDNVNVKVRVANPDRCYVMVNGEKITPTVYGHSIEFTLNSTANSFDIIEGAYTFSMYPDGVKALIIVIPCLVVLIILIVISNILSSKKEKKAKAEAEARKAEEEKTLAAANADAIDEIPSEEALEAPKENTKEEPSDEAKKEE